MTPHRLAAALDQARKDQDIGVHQLAAMAGVSVSTIWLLGSGTHKPRLDTVDLIADALGYELRLVKRGGESCAHGELAEVYAFDNGPAGLFPVSAADLAGLRSPTNRSRIRRAWQTAWQPIEEL